LAEHPPGEMEQEIALVTAMFKFPFQSGAEVGNLPDLIWSFTKN
jgi:hypothetical protein